MTTKYEIIVTGVAGGRLRRVIASMIERNVEAL